NQSKNKRTVWMARVDLIVGDHCGTCANSDGEKCKAPDSGQRNGLREHERLGECVAKRIPGKPAEETTAQPFRGSHRGGERQNSFRAAYPDQPGDRKTKARVKRQISGQSGNGDRQKPAEGLGIDEKGVSDPINSSEEIPEAKTPAGHSGRDGAAPSSGGGSVHEPDQNWKCHEQNRPCVDGRHGQSRRGAGNECYACAPPAYGEHDSVSQAGNTHGWRTPAEPVSLRGDLSSGVVGEAVTLENMPSASLRLRASRCRSRLSFSRVIRTRLTRRGSASRTSNSKRSGPGTISPRTGRRPARVTRYPPMVSTSSIASPTSKSLPTVAMTSSILARASATNEPSGSCVISGVASSSCSSAMSPTICSTISSIEASPSVPPYSSTTSERWIRVACICANRSMAGIEGGT